MVNVDQRLKFNNVFKLFEVDNCYNFRDLQTICHAVNCEGYRYSDFAGVQEIFCGKNLVMDTVKIETLASVWTQATQLLITSQTTDPVGTEVKPSTGIIYTATSAHETLRLSTQNPYVIAWGITSESANGAWGSVSLLKADDTLMNRVRVNISKQSNKIVLVEFRSAW